MKEELSGISNCKEELDAFRRDNHMMEAWICKYKGEQRSEVRRIRY